MSGRLRRRGSRRVHGSTYDPAASHATPHDPPAASHGTPHDLPAASNGKLGDHTESHGKLQSACSGIHPITAQPKVSPVGGDVNEVYEVKESRFAAASVLQNHSSINQSFVSRSGQVKLKIETRGRSNGSDLSGASH